MKAPRVIVSDTLNVTLFDTGDSILLSGLNLDDVVLVIRQLIQMGITIIDKPTQVGSIWTASCRRPAIADDDVQVEKLGHRLFVRGRVLEAVRTKVGELTHAGAHLDNEIEEIDGYFIAVCHASAAD